MCCQSVSKDVLFIWRDVWGAKNTPQKYERMFTMDKWKKMDGLIGRSQNLTTKCLYQIYEDKTRLAHHAGELR